MSKPMNKQRYKLVQLEDFTSRFMTIFGTVTTISVVRRTVIVSISCALSALKYGLVPSR